MPIRLTQTPTILQTAWRRASAPYQRFMARKMTLTEAPTGPRKQRIAIEADALSDCFAQIPAIPTHCCRSSSVPVHDESAWNGHSRMSKECRDVSAQHALSAFTLSRAMRSCGDPTSPSSRAPDQLVRTPPFLWAYHLLAYTQLITSPLDTIWPLGPSRQYN